nr:MAG TPA: hypothetical protein [Caudoviricetes sp.]DAV54029.1 MAG TPA: hypothetical protein [Caudoviricetes sp.]
MKLILKKILILILYNYKIRINDITKVDKMMVIN